MNRVSLGLLVVASSIALAQNKPAAFDLNERGLAAATRGDYALAQSLYREAIQAWESMGPDYRPHRATSEANLAESLGAVGHRREGVELLEKALAEFRRSLGVENLRTLTTMNLLGAYSAMLGDDAHAGSIYREALAVERRLFPNDVQYARSLTGLSMVLLHQDHVADAIPLAEEALTVALKAEGDQTLDAALAYGNMAEVHRVAGHPERALPLYRKARAIYEQVLGPNHPRVASILSQEGLILMQDGKLTLADKEMRQSLDMLSKYCPGCVFEEVVGETNLGMLRMKQQRYREADALLEHSIELQEKNWDKRGSLLAATLQALARVKEKERLHSDATRLSRRADLILAFQ